MKFSDYQYERPDVEHLAKEVEAKTNILIEAKTLEEAQQAVKEVIAIGDHFGTMATLCSIRNSINTVDEFYEKETEYLDENTPKFNNATNKFSKALVSSKFRKELEEIYTEQFFTQNEL